MLQLESLAHIAIQRRIDERLESEPNLAVTTSEFLRWIHRSFYEQMPDEFRSVEHGGVVVAVVPGELRRSNGKVGRHIAPSFEALDVLVARFHEVYEPSQLGAAQRIVASAAAHQRLGWIHPFVDGNGRVMRLFSHSYLRRAGVEGHGLQTSHEILR